MTNGTGLAGIAAAVNIDEYIELANGIGELEGRTDDHLQGFIAEVFVEIPLVYKDLVFGGN